MTIANELRAEVAIGLLENGKGDPKELLNIFDACDLVFRRLSSEANPPLREKPDEVKQMDASRLARSSHANCRFFRRS